MASLISHSASFPVHDSVWSEQDSLFSPGSDPLAAWATPLDTFAPFPTSPLAWTPPGVDSPTSPERTPSSVKFIHSSRSSPVTSLESGGESEDEPQLRTPDDSFPAFTPVLFSPTPRYPHSRVFDVEAFRDKPGARKKLKPVAQQQVLSATAPAFLPSVDASLPPPSRHECKVGLANTPGGGAGHRGVGELARQPVPVDLRNTRDESASSLPPSRDSFTFFPSPLLRPDSPAPSNLHFFSSSAALRSPQPRTTAVNQARSLARLAPATPASRLCIATDHKVPPAQTSAALASPCSPARAPRHDSEQVHHLAPPPLQPYIPFNTSSDIPTCGAPPPLGPIHLPSSTSGIIPHGHHSLRPSPPLIPPFDPTARRKRTLHNGRVPSLAQLAPPQHVEAAASSPVINTGNVGPMVVQAGDWRCGVCAFVNWRRRRICMKCFPYANDIGQVLTIQTQRAAHLAQVRPTSTASTVSSPAAGAGAALHDGYFATGASAAPHLPTSPAISFDAHPPLQRSKTSSSSAGVPSASVAALARARTLSAPKSLAKLVPPPRLGAHSAATVRTAPQNTLVCSGPSLPVVATPPLPAPAPSTPRTLAAPLPPMIWTTDNPGTQVSPSSAASGSSATSAGELAAKRAAAAGRMRDALRGRDRGGKAVGA